VNNGCATLSRPNGPLAHEREVGVVVVERERVHPERLEYTAGARPHGPPPDAPLDQRRVRVVEHELEDALSEVEAYRIVAPTGAGRPRPDPIPKPRWKQGLILAADGKSHGFREAQF
jgi:hypothetical protein